jgi:hypothetical protein
MMNILNRHDALKPSVGASAQRTHLQLRAKSVAPLRHVSVLLEAYIERLKRSQHEGNMEILPCTTTP